MTANLEYASAAGQSESGRQFPILDRQGHQVVNDNGTELVGLPLDNRSIVKRYLGDLAYGAAAISIGPEQLMDPEISGAVEYTGKFGKNPYKRIGVSLDPIMMVVHAKDPYAAGARVKGFHEGIHGKDYKGRRFNALSPEAFFGAHDTFRRGVQNMAENFSPVPFTDADRNQLQLESTTWYSYYGMPMNMVPAEYEENREYRRKRVENRLEMTPAADRVISMALDRKPPRPESVPKPVWVLAKIALMPTTEVMSLLTIGELPEDIRQRFSIPFSDDEQGRLQEIRNIVKAFWTPLPDAVRYYPPAYKSRLRENNGQHKNVMDHIAYKGISVGRSTVMRTVIPALSRVQSAWSQIAA